MKSGSSARIEGVDDKAEGDVALDIGGNFGWYTTLLSRAVGPGGQVHAFEPRPETYEVLKKNCELNGASNVTLNRFALGEKRGRRFPRMHADATAR